MRREDALFALEKLGRQPDETIDLAEAALLLATVDIPDMDLSPYRRHLAQLASDLTDVAPADLDALEDCAAALREVMNGRHGYRGDTATYNDLANANLMRVIDRRRGLPVALGILYLHAARAQGWRAFGVNFPGHFLVAIEGDEERVILDPFDDGRQVDIPALSAMLKRALGLDAELEPEHCASMTNRGVLLRLENNIKTRAKEAGDLERAASVVDSMLAIAPEVPDLWREAAELRAETGKMRSALAALDRFLILSDDSERPNALALRRHLAARIN